MQQNSDLFRSRYQQALEEELRETLAGQDGLLHNMLLYQLGWIDEEGTSSTGPSGERLHPLLCLLSCESLVGEYGPALPAAAAVELVHNFSLIHEDVQSGSPNRGERSTVWWVWGPGQAINAGDGMHALSRLALLRLQERGLSNTSVLKAMQLLDQSCLSMCEGQHLDLAFQEKLDVGVDSYFKMAAGKTGALMSCALGLGALTATQDDEVVQAFKECGNRLGIAYQIKQDIQELREKAGGVVSSGNLEIKKKLLPIVYTLETGDPRTKRELGTIYFKRILEPPDVEKIISILDNESALSYAQEKVVGYSQSAMESLKGIALSQWGREELEGLCQRMMACDG